MQPLYHERPLGNVRLSDEMRRRRDGSLLHHQLWKNEMCSILFLSLQASELLDSLARGGISLALDKQAILIVELCWSCVVL